MFYTIYKITNNINKKTYIGKHQTKNLDDGYMGSGKLIRNAIKKYGVENFTKEILHVFDNEHDMDNKEKELVNEEFVKSSSNYNICEGGKGGFSYINSTIWDDQKRLDHNRKVSGLRNLTYEQRRFYANQNVERGIGIHSPDFKNPTKGFSGKRHSEDAKKKIGSANSLNRRGNQNSQYGTIWVTNGSSNKKIKKEDIDKWLELGYNKGRK